MTVGWIDGSTCSLPTVEQPLRLSEFDTLFEEAVRHVDVVTPTTTRLILAGPAGLARRVRDLTERESACCSFFIFSIDRASVGCAAEAVTLDITVPSRHAAVLAALTHRAATAAPVKRRNGRD